MPKAPGGFSGGWSASEFLFLDQISERRDSVRAHLSLPNLSACLSVCKFLVFVQSRRLSHTRGRASESGDGTDCNNGSETKTRSKEKMLTVASLGPFWDTTVKLHPLCSHPPPSQASFIRAPSWPHLILAHGTLRTRLAVCRDGERAPQDYRKQTFVLELQSHNPAQVLPGAGDVQSAWCVRRPVAVSM